MRRKTSQPVIKSIQELISDYDRLTLVSALDKLKHDTGWKVISAACMQEYLRTVSYQLDLASKTGKQIEAAYQAGVAQALYDVANNLIPQYITVLENKMAVTEDVRPEE